MVRVWDSASQRFEDVILCDANICAKCLKTGKSGEMVIKIQHSPTERLPAVHIGQNTKKDENSEYVFRQTGPAAIEQLVLPEDMQTVNAKFWCQSGGEAKLVRVLGYIAKSCAVCTPTHAEYDSNEGSENDESNGPQCSLVAEGEPEISSPGNEEEESDASEDEDSSDLDDGPTEEEGEDYQPVRKRQRFHQDWAGQ